MTKKSKFRAPIFLAAVCWLFSAQVVAAQDDTLRERTSTISSPLVVKQSKPKGTWMQAEVVHADRNSIVVRERNNPLFIHTFTYGPQVKSLMENRADNGVTFNSGDPVKIQYVPGATVALKIHGKPSKQ